jgi:hypothetical protein
MLRLAIALCLVAGCSKGEPAKKSEAAPAKHEAALAPVTPTSGSPLSFVPSEISGRLVDANTLIAVDFGRMNLGKVAALLAKEAPCIADLMTKVGVVVIGEGEGYVTKLPEKETRECFGPLVPMFGGHLENNVLAMGGDKYSLVWDASMLRVTRVGHAAQPKLADAQRARVARVPAGAVAWIVSNGYPKYKIKESVFWLETGDTHWRFTVVAEGTEPGVARPWVEGIVTGFKEGAAQKGLVIDDRWFTLTSTDTSAKLVGSIPVSLFDPSSR